MALIWDLETDNLLHDVTKIHCLVVIDEADGIAQCFINDNMLEGIKYLFSASKIVGHNILGFDLEVIKKLYGLEYSGEVFDTLLCSRLIWSDIYPVDIKEHAQFLPKKLWGQHSLEAWGYRLKELKGDFGEQENAWEVFTPEMLKYCEQDVRVTTKLYQKMAALNYSAQAIKLEHDFAKIIQFQERTGVLFDKPKAIQLYTTLSKRRLELELECSKVFPGWWVDMKTPEYYTLSICAQFAGGVSAMGHFPTKGAALKAGKEEGFKPKDMLIEPGPMAKKHTPFNPGSRMHIARALTETYGWKPTEFTEGGDAKVDDEILGKLVYPEAKILTEYLMVGKRIGQIAEGENAWIKLEKQGRIYGRVTTNGAATGRCTHSNPNMAQVPACGAPYGKDCRELFTVPLGYKLVGWDASGLELRCLAHYMAPYDGGAYAKELLSGDIHTLNQKAAGLPTRDNAKKFIYVYLYGGGDDLLGAVVGKGAAEGKRLKAQFLKQTPALKRLREDVIRASKRGYLKGLDGRHVPIRSEHAALNTLLQGAGAIACKLSLIILDNKLSGLGWRKGSTWSPVLNVHDEVQAEVKEDLASFYGEMAVQSIQEAGTQLGFKCPLTGEYKIGNNWKETH